MVDLIFRKVSELFLFFAELKERKIEAAATARTPGLEVIKLFFILSSAEHEIFPAHKC